MSTHRVREFLRTGKWAGRDRPRVNTAAVRRDLRSGVLVEDQKRAESTIDALLRENGELSAENDALRSAFRVLCEATGHDNDGRAAQGACTLCGVAYDADADSVPASDPLPTIGGAR